MIAHSPLIVGKTARAVEARALTGATASAKKKRRKMIRLALRDGKVCHWCGRHVVFQWEAKNRRQRRRQATFDHVITKQAGGSFSVDNGVLACKRCNNVRGNRKYEDFKVLLKEKGIKQLAKEFYQATKNCLTSDHKRKTMVS